MSSHSLFHSAGNAHCKAPWSEMDGAENARRCFECAAAVYRLDGLSEEAAVELIRTTEPQLGGHLRLFRRYDGTFTTSDQTCGGIEFTKSDWHAWTASVAFCLKALKNSPPLSVGLILLCAVPAHGLLTLPIQMVSVCLMCRIACQYSAMLDKSSSPLLGLTQKDLGWAIVLFYVYALEVGLGTLLLFVPGLMAAIHSCLALPIICLEHCGPLEALARSRELTRGTYRKVIRTMTIPFTLQFLLVLTPVVIWALSALVAFPGAGLWQVLMYGFDVIKELLFALLSVSFIPLQVNLYRQLKARKQKMQVAAIADSQG